jgi:hypothetical protein
LRLSVEAKGFINTREKTIVEQSMIVLYRDESKLAICRRIDIE